MDERPMQLGDKAKDLVSGWEGILTSYTVYLNGCVRWAVDGVDKDGKPEAFMFDEQQLKVVAPNVVPAFPTAQEQKQQEQLERTGGPRDRRPPPRR